MRDEHVFLLPEEKGLYQQRHSRHVQASGPGKIDPGKAAPSFSSIPPPQAFPLQGTAPYYQKNSTPDQVQQRSHLIIYTIQCLSRIFNCQLS